MNFPTVEWISQGIYRDIPSEDVVGHLRRERSILAWAIDGASTLTESPFTTFEHITDAGWFARELAGFLEQTGASKFSPAKLRDGLASLRQTYGAATRNSAPLDAWPVAAAIIAEIDFSIDTGVTVSLYRYADCFGLIHQGPLPRANNDSHPTMRPRTYDEWKPCSGFEGQRLAELRDRRRQQQRNEFNSALTLNPESALNATHESFTVDRPAHLLLGTDGLSRVWDTYALMTRDDVLRLVAQTGLPTLLDLLRSHEATVPAGSNEQKRRDDASGVFVSFL